jgi:hypothetical protein
MRDGRWLSRDRISELGGISLYAYVLNSPNTKIELFGDSVRNMPPGTIIQSPTGGSTSALYDPSFQWHHPIPWNNTEFDHSSHDLVRKACYNLKSEQKLIALQGHAGKHSPEMHQEVTRRLDAKYRTLGPNKDVSTYRQALNEVVDKIIDDIRTQKLKLYPEKIVIEVPYEIAKQRPDIYGFVRRMEATKRTGGFAAITLEFWDIIKAAVILIQHPNIRELSNGNWYDPDTGQYFDSDLNYLGTDPSNGNT